MNMHRIGILIAALALLGACAQSGSYSGAATRGNATPLAFLGAADPHTPTMSMEELYREMQSGQASKTLPDLAIPEWHAPDLSSEPAIGVSARSSFSLL